MRVSLLGLALLALSTDLVRARKKRKPLRGAQLEAALDEEFGTAIGEVRLSVKQERSINVHVNPTMQLPQTSVCAAGNL
eukprot:SAG11_NODE_3401_length_2468_cov_1.688054_4_plen_79_part_00